MSDLATKGFCASTMTYYAVTFAEIRIVAKDLGYALALHGSLKSDLDVVAIPWIENPASEEELVKAICEQAGGCISHGFSYKPNGRKAWTIWLGGCSAKVAPGERATYIDLSIMPIIPKTPEFCPLCGKADHSGPCYRFK